MTSKIKCIKLPSLNTIVIKQIEGRDFFITTQDSLVIGISSLVFILHFLIMNGFLSPKTLEGILEEWYSNRKEDPVV